ncbi:MAG TPA: EVE domain-containing protein [Blastocatellia bacterium]|nr:EVE domain-containing protein [Blastocatellia bacterium]
MKHFLNLFSPETFDAFTRSGCAVSGFRERHRIAASKVSIGDRLICYVTGLSRWTGILEVCSNSYEEMTPIFFTENDPFIVRFNVKPVIWLELEQAIPIYDDQLWNNLSFTKGQTKGSSSWTGKIRSSLTQIDDSDALLLEAVLKHQKAAGNNFPFDDNDLKKLTTHTVRRLDKDITVTVPEDTDISAEGAPTSNDVRESIKIQALIAEIGSRMGMQIWIPRSDRSSVLTEWKGDHPPILDRLPLNYDDTTLRTIEQIDVLWLKGRSIRRAFEVEHTTSIYSGILRMADLQALQPNMDIRLHIVAPESRREKVFSEIRRPVFSLLDRGPLSENCTYLSYNSIRELAGQPHLAHLSDTVLEEYSEQAEG